MKPLSTNLNLKLLVFVFLAFTFSNCEKEQNPLTEPIQKIPDEGMIKLGEKLENPFLVENMKMAYSNLKSSNSDIPELEIKTTHLYIRFLSKNFDELSLLKNDSTLVLYEIPMDYEIIEPIENALKGAKTWSQWKDNLKNKYDNATENQLDNLFNYWAD